MKAFSILGNLRSLLESSSGRDRRSARRNRRSAECAAEIQMLEPRKMMTVTFHGGAELPHVEAQAIYLGSSWDFSTTLASQKTQLEAYLPVLVGGAYMDMLTIAGYNVGRGTTSAGVVDALSINSVKGATPTISDGTIQHEIQKMIGGSAQSPDSNRLYIVYVEPGVVVTQGGKNSVTGFLGYHGAFAGTTASGSPIDVHYAVLAYPGAPNYTASSQGFTSNINALTEATSHEVTEAVTDPNVNYKTKGWYDDQKNGEIGDLANLQQFTFQGYDVQKEVNQSDQVILPNEPPIAAQNVTLKATSPTALTVSWTDSADPVGGYRVLEHVGSQYIQLASVNALTSSVTVPNLTPGSTYSISVAPYLGQFVYISPSVSITMPQLVTAPTNLNLTALSANMASLSWTASSGPVEGYKIYGFVGSSEVLLMTVSASTTSVKIGGLVPGSINSFKVQAYEIGGYTADSAIDTITMPKLKLHKDM